MSYKNQSIWARLSNIRPSFKYEVVEGQKCPRFIHWPTVGASQNPLRAGRAVSIQEIEKYVEAVESGQKPAFEFDEPEFQREVSKEIRRRRRARKRLSRPRLDARDSHGYLW